ncbi:hypothetical protein SAV31267_018460 [Streptomyces avermitilis]|uniref:Uncharacterized protein n=1 Tax=Streptomyces avermitilis TaxID=33903 RepID=A0A4D4MJV8_STRAX|nr:hypothetical protein SAV31267_018460 [Streptomyces avermitilis]
MSDAGAAYGVHLLVPAGLQDAGDRGGRGRHRAVHGLPGVTGRARPGVLLGPDGHPHAGRGDRGAHTPAALEPAFQFELFQSLAERGAGDAEAGREVTLVRQDLAHRELGVECLTEHGLEMPVLRLRYRFQLRGPHPVLRNRRGPAAF